MISILLIPVAQVFMFGRMVGTAVRPTRSTPR